MRREKEGEEKGETRRKERDRSLNNHSRSITTSDSSAVEDETADAGVRVAREREAGKSSARPHPFLGALNEERI